MDEARVPTEEIAEVMGVTPSTIHKWRRNHGCPSIPVGKDFYFNPEKVRAWKAEHPELGAAPEGGRPSTLIDGQPLNELLGRVKIRKELALAARHEHNLELLRREVIPASEVREGNLRRIAEVRANLLALPGKLAGSLVGLSEREVYARLDEEVRAMLARFARGGVQVTEAEKVPEAPQEPLEKEVA